MKDFEKQEIKTMPVMSAQLKMLRDMAGSYDALFSRRAIKYREMNLSQRALTEEDIRKLILEEYTFLRRPLIIVEDELFIGHQEETIQAVQKKLNRK